MRDLLQFLDVILTEGVSTKIERDTLAMDSTLRFSLETVLGNRQRENEKERVDMDS